MAKWVRSFTYEPKIAAVRRGDCTQTIRPKHNVKVGDRITFHGWESRPYRSRWSWRFKAVVSDVLYIIAHIEGIALASSPDDILPWDTPYCNRLAKLDHISPATGKDMGELFNSVHDLKDGFDMQIIRWPSHKGVVQSELGYSADLHDVGESKTED